MIPCMRYLSILHKRTFVPFACRKRVLLTAERWEPHRIRLDSRRGSCTCTGRRRWRPLRRQESLQLREFVAELRDNGAGREEGTRQNAANEVHSSVTKNCEISRGTRGSTGRNEVQTRLVLATEPNRSWSRSLRNPTPTTTSRVMP